MVLYKIIIIIFIIFSNIFCATNDIYNDDTSLSIVGNSNLIEGDCKISFGFSGSELPFNSNFFSINKLISHNMIVSSLLSKYRLDRNKIFLQNSILIKSLNNSISLQMITNYLFSGSNTDKWITLGFNYYFILRNNILSLGSTYSSIDENKVIITNSLNIERRVNRKLSVNYSFLYNKYVNSNLIKLSINI